MLGGFVLNTQKNDRHYCVYIHIFPNQKTYVGITGRKPEYRWGLNGSGYKPKKENSSRVWNAIQKYGWENIEHKILYDGLTKEEACLKEIETIELYKSYNREFGYNIASGGTCPTLTEETKQKISQARKGNNYGKTGENAPMYGKHHTEDARKKISIAMSGINNPFYGKTHSEDTKTKEIIKHLDECKTIEQYDKDGNLIERYWSVHEASRRTGINRACIIAALNGTQKTAGKCLWVPSDIPSYVIFEQCVSISQDDD